MQIERINLIEKNTTKKQCCFGQKPILIDIIGILDENIPHVMQYILHSCICLHLLLSSKFVQAVLVFPLNTGTKGVIKIKVQVLLLALLCNPLLAFKSNIVGSRNTRDSAKILISRFLNRFVNLNLLLEVSTSISA